MRHGLQLNTAGTVGAGGTAKELHHCGGDAAAESRRAVAGIDAVHARAGTAQPLARSALG
jgi:hypothetical protein